MAADPGRTRRITKFLGEFVLIVTGVLVSLAGESWWNDREERDRERAYLEQLYQDVEENLARLRGVIAREDSSFSAKETILAALQYPATISRDSAEAWMVTRHGAFI